MSRLAQIACPQCRGILEVNLETGRVVRHWPAKQDAAGPSEDLSALVEKVKQKGGQGLPDIERALEEQRKKRDAEFERARRKLVEDGNAPPAPPQSP